MTCAGQKCASSLPQRETRKSKNAAHESAAYGAISWRLLRTIGNLQDITKNSRRTESMPKLMGETGGETDVGSLLRPECRSSPPSVPLQSLPRFRFVSATSFRDGPLFPSRCSSH